MSSNSCRQANMPLSTGHLTHKYQLSLYRSQQIKYHIPAQLTQHHIQHGY